MPEPYWFSHPYDAIQDAQKYNVYKALKKIINAEGPQESNIVTNDANGSNSINSTLPQLHYHWCRSCNSF